MIPTIYEQTEEILKDMHRIDGMDTRPLVIHSHTGSEARLHERERIDPGHDDHASMLGIARRCAQAHGCPPGID